MYLGRTVQQAFKWSLIRDFFCHFWRLYNNAFILWFQKGKIIVASNARVVNFVPILPHSAHKKPKPSPPKKAFSIYNEPDVLYQSIGWLSVATNNWDRHLQPKKTKSTLTLWSEYGSYTFEREFRVSSRHQHDCLSACYLQLKCSYLLKNLSR